ncbi:MAG: hypothetical protein ACKOZX_04290 [Gammaproteobacteria bacterium]
MLVKTLPMLEARDSSEIENIVTTADLGAYNRARHAARLAVSQRGTPCASE